MTYTARRNNVTVPVVKNGKGWCVSWCERVGAKRTRKTFTDYERACRFADEVALRVANGTKRGLSLTDAEVAEYRTARHEAGDTPLLSAVREWKAARAILGTLSLLEAAKAFADKNPTLAQIPPTAQIVAELSAKLTARECSQERHVGPLVADLAPFAVEFPNLRTVTTVAIEKYLSTLRTKRARSVRGVSRPAGSPLSKRRRDNIRDAVATLFGHAIDAGYLSAPNIAARVPKLNTGTDIGTYTPDQMAAIIEWTDAHARELLPWVVIGAFAGLRSSEIQRLEWSAFRWRSRVIYISKKVADKVKQSRQVPILPALAEWLAPWSHLTTGRVVPEEITDIRLSRTRAKMCQTFGWTHWEPNALRHSYASYRGRTHTRAVVAEEMGTSPTMLKNFYDNLPLPEDATAYFESIRPERPTNVTQLTA